MKQSDNTADWAAIAAFSDPAEAYITRGMLESNGIPVVVNNATISSIYPMTDTWAPLELLVPADMADVARSLIDGKM